MIKSQEWGKAKISGASRYDANAAFGETHKNRKFFPTNSKFVW